MLWIRKLAASLAVSCLVSYFMVIFFVIPRVSKDKRDMLVIPFLILYGLIESPNALIVFAVKKHCFAFNLLYMLFLLFFLAVGSKACYGTPQESAGVCLVGITIGLEVIVLSWFLKSILQLTARSSKR